MANGPTNLNNLQITEWKVVPCENSHFVQPARVIFKQNGRERTWDYVRAHHGVYILIYNTSRKAFVLVKQFRPALYMAINREQSTDNQLLTENVLKVDNVPCKAAYSQGVAYELCAGLVDKQVSLIDVAREEVLEECGYNVPAEKVWQVTSWRNEVGHEASKQTLFYAEVTDAMLVSGAGGGNTHEGEFIEVFYLPVTEMKKFMYDEEVSKQPSLMFAFLWWDENIQKQRR